MAYVTIATGMVLPNGQDEGLFEYLCDRDGCANVAEHVVGYVRELSGAYVVCGQHAIRESLASRSVVDS